MWGWSWLWAGQSRRLAVFPMYVGVIPLFLKCQYLYAGIPHVCGGDPWREDGTVDKIWYSPCMWGWSLIVRVSNENRAVFPMYVGVILNNISQETAEKCIPHVCGGDPRTDLKSPTLSLYSPCMWGWSYLFKECATAMWVFPMYVGVILQIYGR